MGYVAKFLGGTPSGPSGSGATNRIAFWTSATNLGSDAGFTKTGTGDTFTVILGSTSGQKVGLSKYVGVFPWELAIGTGPAGNAQGFLRCKGITCGADTSIGAVIGDANSGGGIQAMGAATIGFVPASDLTAPSDTSIWRAAAGVISLGTLGIGDSSGIYSGLKFQGTYDTATPGSTFFSGATAAGTDLRGANAYYQAGRGTGTGASGNVIAQTHSGGATGTTPGVFSDRLVLAGQPVTLTESSATPVLDVAVASGTVAGGTVWYTIRANDATDFQALRGQVQWSAVNKGGTLTAAIVLVGSEILAASAGTLTNTATITTGTNLITINLNAVSSLTQTTLYAYVSAQVDGTGTVTTK